MPAPAIEKIQKFICPNKHIEFLLSYSPNGARWLKCHKCGKTMKEVK